MTTTSDLVQTIKNEIISQAKESPYIENWFLKDHLMEVENNALWLCNLLPEADREIVILSVWFHDVGRFVGKDDDHDAYGSNFAKKRLSSTNLPIEKVQNVVDSCLSHRASHTIPKTVEAKILATADAMSHFTAPNFYLRIFHRYASSSSFEDAVISTKQKLERDFHKKIFFDEARQRILPIYEAMSLLLKENFK